MDANCFVIFLFVKFLLFVRNRNQLKVNLIMKEEFFMRLNFMQTSWKTRSKTWKCKAKSPSPSPSPPPLFPLLPLSFFSFFKLLSLAPVIYVDLQMRKSDKILRFLYWSISVSREVGINSLNMVCFAKAFNIQISIPTTHAHHTSQTTGIQP